MSAVFCAQTLKENALLKKARARLRYWYAVLYAWVLGQGLQPPTPEPSRVEKVEGE